MDRRRLIRDAGLAGLAMLLPAGAARAAAQAGPGATVLVAYYSVTGNTEKMAHGVAEGVAATAGAKAVIKRVGEVVADDLLSADAVIVGSPVYFGNMAGDVKIFFDNWALKYGVFGGLKMRNKPGAAFVTGGSIANGKDTTLLGILEAMLGNQMVIVNAAGGYGASATTGPDSPGIDDKKLATARELGKRVAEVTDLMRRGSRQG